MPTHNSHTHCQVAQGNAQAKTWQRVCLFPRTTDRQPDDRKEGRTANRVDGPVQYYLTWSAAHTIPT
jgi:hypothetical protein